MLYVDYHFSLMPGAVVFDEELTLNKTPFKGGEYFVAECGEKGQLILRRIVSVEEFVVKGGHENVQETSTNSTDITDTIHSHSSTG